MLTFEIHNFCMWKGNYSHYMVNSLEKKKKRDDNFSSSDYLLNTCINLSVVIYSIRTSRMPFKFLFDDICASGFVESGRESN